MQPSPRSSAVPSGGAAPARHNGVPGAMDAPLSSAFFWAAMAFSLVVAPLAAWPLNRWLLARGRGHALVHGPGPTA